MTHSIRYLPNVDKIIVMKDGKISETGSYDELVKRNGEFAEFLHNYMTTMDDNSSSEGEGIKGSRCCKNCTFFCVRINELNLHLIQQE